MTLVVRLSRERSYCRAPYLARCGKPTRRRHPHTRWWALASTLFLRPSSWPGGSVVLAFGLWPRLTSIAVYGLLVWRLSLIVIVGGIGAINHWVLDTSCFTTWLLRPPVAPNWRPTALWPWWEWRVHSSEDSL